MFAKHLSVHCHIARFALFSLILPASWSKDSLWVVLSATGSTTRSQVHDRGSKGLSQQITLSAWLWRASKAGNVFFLLEKAPCGRQARQFDLCAALSLSVVKGGNSLKNCKEKQGAGVDAWVILVWIPSFLAKEKNQVGRLRGDVFLPAPQTGLPTTVTSIYMRAFIKCSRETWHQPLGRTDTELPDHTILWDFI